MDLLQKIMAHTGLGGVDLLRIIDTAPLRYKSYAIDKRSGGKRIIAQPSRELKLIQRFVMGEILSKFPVHPSAMAYAIGRNIYQNAELHKNNSVVLKLDFHNFFPSIIVKDWRTFISKSPHISLTGTEYQSLAKILFWGMGDKTPRCLSIGAPTSPMLSNVLLYDFDRNISKLASENGVIYSRYSDDITVSANSAELLIKFEKIIYTEVDKLKTPKLTFNQAKRGLYTKGQKRMVTGLIITPTQDVSIGRERKRAISALVHKFTLNQLDREKIGYLKGMLGFAITNEPDFVSRLRKKYGDKVIDSILSTFIEPRIKQQILPF